MTTKNADAPAFPDNWDAKYGGLTKREYFAAMAMQGIAVQNADFGTSQVVKWAVDMADALLKELENEN